jgi:predicted RNA-binding Zn ribbon-like protein
MSNDWRNGFLFVGNDLALDFLNTRPVMEGQPVEMLADGEALAKWASAAGLLNDAQAERLGRRWKGPRSAATIKDLHHLRENLRRVVFQMEAGSLPPGGFVNDLNRLLSAYPGLDQVVRGDSGLERRKQFALELPEHIFAPLADAIAGLVTRADPSRLRKCQSCVLHFRDTSKKGTRVWCSMGLCGNRSKVAAYADRKRAALDGE